MQTAYTFLVCMYVAMMIMIKRACFLAWSAYTEDLLHFLLSIPVTSYILYSPCITGKQDDQEFLVCYIVICNE